MHPHGLLGLALTDRLNGEFGAFSWIAAQGLQGLSGKSTD